MTSISDGKVVSISYTLKNDAGKVLDSSSADDPLLYLQGCENLVPGLEKELEGHAVGDKVAAVVSPADGYGERVDAPLEEIPRASFPDDAPLAPGLGFGVEDEDGNELVLFVNKVEGGTVFVDVNHPLAGETLHFDVEVLAVRDATEDERAHGHPHGPTGHEGHSH